MNGSIPVVGNMSHDVAPWIERLARVGYAAKGVLYVTIGLLAAGAAVGVSDKQVNDSHGAMSTLIEAPFGRVLLGVISIGLIGYAVWRVIEGVTDPERRGKDAKGIAMRASFIARGLVHLGLAYTAGMLAIGQLGKSNGDNSELWTGRAMSLPGGVYILWAIGAAFFGYGAYQLYRAYASKLSKKLELGRLSHTARRWVIGLSRFGIAARGIVFGTIGVLFARAAQAHNPKEAGGVGDSMRELTGLGQWPYAAIALGLAAYGIYELVNARYRRITVR